MINEIRHWLAHLLGWNYGRIETFNIGERLFVCFVCSCGARVAEHDVTALLDYDWEHI